MVISRSDIWLARNMRGDFPSKGFGLSQFLRCGVIWREEVPRLQIDQSVVGSTAVKVAHFSSPLRSQGVAYGVAGITPVGAMQHEDESRKTIEIGQAIHVVHHVERRTVIVCR